MNKLFVTTAVGLALLAVSSLSMAADSTTSTTTTSSTTTKSVTALSNGFEASGIMKADIKSKAGDTIGSIEDIIINSDGKAVGIVADVGGFLGIGDRDVLLDWKSVTIQRNGDTLSVTTDLDKNTISQKQPYKLVSR